MLYSLRTNLNRENWLIDISYWSSINHVINNLKSLQLDFDDDLFLYSSKIDGEYEFISIWEMYKIHHTMPSKVMQYGNWSTKNGIMVMETNKWIRRKNLQVNYSNLLCIFMNNLKSVCCQGNSF